MRASTLRVGMLAVFDPQAGPERIERREAVRDGSGRVLQWRVYTHPAQYYLVLPNDEVEVPS